MNSTGRNSARSALHRDRLRLYARILLASAAIGAGYGALLGQPGVSTGLSMLVGAINGAGIAGCIGGIEIFLLREGSSMRRLKRLPFAVLVLLKTAAYATIICFFIIFAPRLGQLHRLGAHAELAAIGFSLAMTLFIVLMLQLSALVGRRTFRNLLLGRYRQPHPERRFFLFVDVVGSTAIAERLGALQAHRFLASVFSATAEAIAACRGEIYQYVGDEIVVTWTEAEGRAGLPKEAWPLRCLFEMRAALEEQAAAFRGQFGAEPGLRAALHLGEVIAGEVGEQRRAIVFHGDVMNTAARLEQATRDTGCRFIASAEALAALGERGEYAVQDLGELALRGRVGKIRASGVELP